MPQQKFDAVIEAVRYGADGKISLVRVYERRGATFSDRVLLSRADLCTWLGDGKKIVTGQRKELLASTFVIEKEVHLAGGFVSVGANAQKDQMEGVPLF